MTRVVRPVASVQPSMLPARPVAVASQRWRWRTGRCSRMWSGSSGAAATPTSCSGTPWRRRPTAAMLTRMHGWAPRTRPCGWPCRRMRIPMIVMTRAALRWASMCRRTRTPTTTVMSRAASRCASVLTATPRTRVVRVARAARHTAWRCGGVAVAALATRARRVAPRGADARHQGLRGSAELAAELSPGSGGYVGISAIRYPILGCPGRVRLARVGADAHLADVCLNSQKWLVAGARRERRPGGDGTQRRGSGRHG
jgi:hypothetical protein